MTNERVVRERTRVVSGDAKLTANGEDKSECNLDVDFFTGEKILTRAQQDAIVAELESKGLLRR